VYFGKMFEFDSTFMEKLVVHMHYNVIILSMDNAHAAMA